MPPGVGVVWESEKRRSGAVHYGGRKRRCRRSFHQWPTPSIHHFGAAVTPLEASSALCSLRCRLGIDWGSNRRHPDGHLGTAGGATS